MKKGNYIAILLHKFNNINSTQAQTTNNQQIKSPYFIVFIVGILINSVNLKATKPIFFALDSIPPNLIIQDTSKQNKKGLKQYFKKDYPSPKKAVLLAIVPGMGQIYNKKYWKLPLVYGALGGVIYSIYFNTARYNDLEHSLAVKAGTATSTLANPDLYPNVPENSLVSLRNATDKNRQLSWIGVFAFYLVSAGDALVDAHLKDFSVDDDLSIRPILETNYYNQPMIGIGIQLSLSR